MHEYDDERVTLSVFASLTPYTALEAVESSFAIVLDGTLQPYPSYVNRVYGVRSESSRDYVAKFYRPGRWSVEAIAEEHEFVLECAEAELPVVPPMADPDGYTLQILAVEGDEHEIPFAVSQKRGGRGFDAEADDDWFRLGALAGRVHTVGARGSATHRLTCTPQESTRIFVEEIRSADIVHPDLVDDFFAVVDQGLELITPLFEGVRLQRIHGDFHRGNVLERGREGLLLIDFDDMMIGPPVQDLWLLLPDHAWASRRELALILEGYTQFAPFDESTLRLIEPLRFMRMIYYLAWSAMQRNDLRFRQNHPTWGGRAYWLREVEDLRTQLNVVAEDIGG